MSIISPTVGVMDKSTDHNFRSQRRGEQVCVHTQV